MPHICSHAVRWSARCPGSLLLGCTVLLLTGCPATPPTGNDNQDGVNSVPIADDLDVNVVADESADITLAAFDSDPTDNLTFVILTLPINGTLSLDGSALASAPIDLPSGEDVITYTPDDGYVGSDGFTYAAEDGQSQSEPGAVSITVAIPAPNQTFDADETLEALNVSVGESAEVSNDAILTVTGDASIDGTLFANTGRVQIQAGGDLTINGSIRALDDSAEADDDTALSDQASAIIIVVDGGNLTFGPDAILNTSGPIVITDDASILTQTPAHFYDEVENVAGDELPTLVPLPPDDPAFEDMGAVNLSPPVLVQRQPAPPITISGVWPPAGAAPPRGDRPVVIFRFNGERNLNLDNWTVNGPAAPARDPADSSNDPGSNATGNSGRNGLNLNIWNNGGPINIVNNVVLNLANGGNGGDATAVCASATGGAGGNSGNFRMTAAGGIDLSGGTLTINPGQGGDGGGATVTVGGAGAPGCPGETGEASTATGGKGGDNLKRIFARGNVAGLTNISIGPVNGGAGGIADATSCDGGDGLVCCDGGTGGAATATGGAGGSASLAIGTLGIATGPVNGGVGGDANAFGGFGGHGGDCKLNDAGDGGAGGVATATGGAGGNAASDGGGGALGGDGGDATAEGGGGGDGGDSGFGDPGEGGSGGAAIATGGTAGTGSTAGSVGEADAADGVDGAPGDQLDVILYCIFFDFFGPGSGSLDPTFYDSVPVYDLENATQIGDINVNLLENAVTNYQYSDNPVPHLGFGPGTLEIEAGSLQVEIPPQGLITGLRIETLYGSNLSQERPMIVEAVIDGSVVATQSLTNVPNNEANPEVPTPVDIEFDVEASISIFRITVPEGAFVTFIRIYLIDP